MAKLDKASYSTHEETNVRAGVKPRRHTETIISKIGTKVQACKKIVADIENHQYPILSDKVFNVLTQKDEERPFSYKIKSFLQKEHLFFIQNSTPLGVLQTLDHYVQEDRKHPWELFPTIKFSQAQLAGNISANNTHKCLVTLMCNNRSTRKNQQDYSTQ